MNIGILIFSEPSMEQYTAVDRLTEAGQELGHAIVKLYEPRLSFTRSENRVEILHDGEPLPNLDIIIPRPNFIEEPSLRMYAIQLLTHAGYKLLNSSPTTGWTKNKLAQHVAFHEYNLPCPRWGIARTPEEVARIAETIGYPIILKVAFGTHGKGVFYADSKEVLDPIAEYLVIRDRNPLIVEEFIKEAERKDLRIFVIGKKVVAAMERTAPQGDVRANASNGGIGSKVKLTKEEIALAQEAARVFELDIAGVDLIRSDRGPLILEINSNPGFKELERATGMDIAKEIIQFATK